MHRATVLGSAAVVAAGAAWLAACTGTSSPASPAAPTQASNPPGDDGDATSSSSTSTDAGACSDAGSAVAARFDFAATMVVDGGKGQLLSVHVCDTVTWTNDDVGIPHGVASTGDAGFSFATNTLPGTEAGAPLTPVQFTVPGTYGYDCVVHGKMMSGEITVQ